jgi:hypothetical protein
VEALLCLARSTNWQALDAMILRADWRLAVKVPFLRQSIFAIRPSAMLGLFVCHHGHTRRTTKRSSQWLTGTHVLLRQWQTQLY